MAQTNLGYNYIGKSLEVLNIKPGAYSDKHIKAMDEKANYNKERKATKEFKSRRNNLSRQKTSQTLRKEANEGVTYASSVGLNLNPSNNNKNTSPLTFDLPSDISVDELKRCEE